MTITIRIPATLRAWCQDATEELHLPAAAVQAALDQLQQGHPSLYRSVCDETGAVRHHVNLFVNDSCVRNTDGRNSILEPGDVLTIMPAVSGG